MNEPITDTEREHILAALGRVPRAFRKRLVSVIQQAMEDEDDGTVELSARVSGESDHRAVRQWEAFFRPLSRHRSGQ